MAYATVHGRFVRGLPEFPLVSCYKHRIELVQRYKHRIEYSIKNYLISANSHAALSGSDIMRFIAVEAIKTIPDSNWTYLEHEIFGPRLSLDIPQVIFSLVSKFVSCKGFAFFGIRLIV